jgi:hypothetical protein
MKINENSSVSEITPSQFMRQLRPEYYSDTKDHVEYFIDSSTLEYHLDSITSRNQAQDFEIFCRKLCERTICPNLRAHTGPDGGGDSKADTETYPVAEEIAALFYIGTTKSAQERWAFAFSAKEKWSAKVRGDVKGIVETARDYKRIYFVTSRFARDRDRARIEDELTKEYGIQVTILERSWIVQKITEDDLKDIAYNYLKIGEAKSSPLRLGPNDYSRSQQLSDIEKLLADPNAFDGMEQQRVTEALIAAKLSRNLEKPRFETEGRFDRAIRLAEADGTYRQKLETNYERIWTAFWWFDDFQYLNNAYDSFEKLALKSDFAINLEFLSNLSQILVTSVIHGHLTREECNLDQRIDTLKEAYETIAADNERPNNALEAQTSLVIIRMNQAFLDKKNDDLPNVWNDFSTVLHKARGLGEFKACRLEQMVEVAGNIAGNDPNYNNLIEKMAEFISERKSEAEGALILLRRAQKLDFNNNIEMIRLLGKAAISLSKKEYTDHLIETLQLLMLAYRSAGLLWAARASCIFLAASLVIKSDEDNELSISFIPTMKVWAWIALELRHLPDFLYAIRLLNGALATIPLTDRSKEKVTEDIRELERALCVLLLNLEETELLKLENLPDILEALGLFMARSALLYMLGHIDVLRADGSLPESETNDDVNQFFSMLASHPDADSLRGVLVLNNNAPQILSTAILGMGVEINVEGSTQSILIAEAVLGTLEAYFSTAIEQRIIPHTEKFKINVIERTEISKPSFDMDEKNMAGTINWPADLHPRNFEHQDEILKFWSEVSGSILASCCIIKDAEEFFSKLYSDEAVQNRMTMVAVAATSYHRLASKSISRISDWSEIIQQAFELRSERPELALVQIKEKSTETEQPSDMPTIPKDHRAFSVKSVIDIYAWDQARWRGVAFAQSHPSLPPCFAFLFEDEEGGKKIFERWRERFGEQDKNEELYLSILRRLPNQNEHHYCVMITSKLPENTSADPNQMFAVASRFMTMTPSNSINLENFLSLYEQFGVFYMVPAFFKSSGPPEIAFDLSILKYNLKINEASDISDNDIELMALKTFL